MQCHLSCAAQLLESYGIRQHVRTQAGGRCATLDLLRALTDLVNDWMEGQEILSNSYVLSYFMNPDDLDKRRR